MASPTGWPASNVRLITNSFQFCFSELLHEEVTKHSIIPDLMLHSLFVVS